MTTISLGAGEVDDWDLVASNILSSLADTMDVGGTIEELDVYVPVGRTGFEVVVDATDATGEEQAQAMAVLCDLLDHRHRSSNAQVVGVLLLPSDPEPSAVAAALVGMRRSDGTFTPVVPLAADQAQAIARNGPDLYDLLQDAIALVAVAADRPGEDRANAAGQLIEELATLIERSCTNTPS